MQDHGSDLLIEKFFGNVIKPKRPPHPGNAVWKRYKDVRIVTLAAAALLVTAFTAAIGTLLLAQKHGQEDIQWLSKFVVETGQKETDLSQRIVELKSALNARSNKWYRLLYQVKLADGKLGALLDKKMVDIARTYCVPAMAYLLESETASALADRRWNELFEAFHVYLMLFKKEPIEMAAVAKWFHGRKEEIAQIAAIPQQQIEAILQSMTPQMFEGLQEPAGLYDSILKTMQSAEFAQLIYTALSAEFAEKNPIVVPEFLHLSSLNLFHNKLHGVTMPHLFTKEGFKEFEANQKQLIGKIASIKHLPTVLDVSQVLHAVEETSNLYKQQYRLHWETLLERIQFKRSEDIGSCLALLKALSRDLSSIFTLIKGVEGKILIRREQSVLEKAATLAAKATEQIASAAGLEPAEEEVEEFVAYTPISKEGVKQVHKKLAESLEELVQYTAQISASSNQDRECYDLLVKKGEDSLLRKNEALASTLPTPLDSMYRALLADLRKLLRRHCIAHVNNVWRNEVYNYYVEHLEGKYPFNDLNLQNEVQLEHLVAFFGKNGRLSKFQQEYLGAEQNEYTVSYEAQKALEFFTRVQRCWFAETQLKVAFNITNVTMEGLRRVVLSMMGQELEFTPSRQPLGEFTWDMRSAPRARVRFETRTGTWNSMAYAGKWGWYRLLRLNDSASTAVSAQQSVRKRVHSHVGDVLFDLNFNHEFCSLSAEDYKIPKQVITTSAGEDRHVD